MFVHLLRLASPSFFKANLANQYTSIKVRHARLNQKGNNSSNHSTLVSSYWLKNYLCNKCALTLCTWSHTRGMKPRALCAKVSAQVKEHYGGQNYLPSPASLFVDVVAL